MFKKIVIVAGIFIFFLLMIFLIDKSNEWGMILPMVFAIIILLFSRKIYQFLLKKWK